MGDVHVASQNNGKIVRALEECKSERLYSQIQLTMTVHPQYHNRILSKGQILLVL